jgi:hypothetical protein
VARLDLEYVLPLRWDRVTSAREADGLTAYLAWLARVVEVTVVDGSPPEAFDRHAGLWRGTVRHVPPEPRPGRNGKVAAVVTGVRLARHEFVVVADDDVRYDLAALEQVAAALRAGADVARPQNVLASSSWHARWDTGRTLVARGTGHDHPGTHGLRRSALLATDGYDGDVLFENLEMVRTVRAAGGRVADLPGTYVRRVPPAASHFRGQRVRQAYDSLAEPRRYAVELALLPVLTAGVVGRRPSVVVAVLGGAVAVAERGRRRAGGAAVFERSAALWAVPWALERAACAWLALGARVRGGVRYRGARLPVAATPQRVLDERWREVRRARGVPAGAGPHARGRHTR